LAAAGIATVGQLIAAPEGSVAHLLGNAVATKLLSLSANVDTRRVETTRSAVSVGAQAALGRRDATTELLRTTFAYLSDRVAGRLRAAGRAGRTVSVRVRFTDLRSVTRATTVPHGVSATRTITKIATDLAGRALAHHPDERQITLLAVSVTNLVPEPCVQLELPLETERARSECSAIAPNADWRGVDRSVDAVRARFGHRSVGYAAARFGDADHVPEAFRELAERRLVRPDPRTIDGDGLRRARSASDESKEHR
jgi:DNA polymerase-4